jgi:hypothetical protein
VYLENYFNFFFPFSMSFSYLFFNDIKKEGIFFISFVALTSCGFKKFLKAVCINYILRSGEGKKGSIVRKKENVENEWEGDYSPSMPHHLARAEVYRALSVELKFGMN